MSTERGQIFVLKTLRTEQTFHIDTWMNREQERTKRAEMVLGRVGQRVAELSLQKKTFLKKKEKQNQKENQVT